MTTTIEDLWNLWSAYPLSSQRPMKMTRVAEEDTDKIPLRLGCGGRGIDIPAPRAYDLAPYRLTPPCRSLVKSVDLCYFCGRDLTITDLKALDSRIPADFQKGRFPCS
ncbi:hypothetical protein AFLA_011920 [Aspergillus flavus NRRL3357]|nr:hypothetical protein AFLA_011920 [Aspergillus flavus NRRL3357]